VVSQRKPSDGNGGRGSRGGCAADNRLKEIKRQIKEGDYESEEKLDIAMSRLLADLRNASRGARLRPEDDSGGALP